jgi:hypothetical protein
MFSFKTKILIFFIIIIAGLGILFLLLPTQNNSSSVYPPNKSTTNTLYPTIKAMFSQSVPVQSQKNIRIDLRPDVQRALSWSSDGKTLFANLQKGLAPGQKYSASLINGDKIVYSWIFTAALADKISEKDLSKKQGEEDAVFADLEKNFLKKYPWYKKIPPRNDTYYIGFSSTENKFIADLYPKKDSSMSTDAQVNQLKTIVLDKLKSIGVDTSKFEIVWTIYSQ